MRIEDAHVLVTGASRGIGEAIAREFAAAGSRVTLVARSADALASLAEELRGTAVPADLLDRRARRGLVARVEEEAGPVDVLVNNAGVAEVGDFLTIDADTMERLFTLNDIAPAELCRQVLPGMIERGRGHLVSISSLAGIVTWPGLVVYSATKSALTHFTAGLRMELDALPIGTTVVEIGVVETAMGLGLREHAPTAAAERRYTRLGLTRVVEADAVARATVKAVRTGRSHVRYPRRARTFAALAETPRRLNRLILSGVARRT